MKNNVSYSEIIYAVMFGKKYKYASYDHHKAIEYMKTQRKYDDVFLYNNNPDSYEIPEEIKEKFRVWRIGKLRTVGFDPNGKMTTFVIGNKRNKVFYLNDFGKTVNIINEEDE